MSDPTRVEPGLLPPARLEGLLWAVAAGAWEVDYRTGRYFLSASIQRLLGDPPGYVPEMENVRDLSRVHPEDRALLAAAMQAAAARESGVVDDCEFRLRHRDGTWVWLHTQAQIIERFPDGSPARIAGWHTDITSRKRFEAAIAETTQRVERLSGAAFFECLAQALSSSLGLRYCLIGKLTPDGRVTTLGFSDAGQLRPNFAYDLAGTPCEQALRGDVCLIPDAVADLFPLDAGLRELGAVSYMGMALTGSDGQPCGLIALLDDKPMTGAGFARSLLPLFGARASVEIERMAAEESRLASWRQYRLLFEHLITACAVIEPVFSPEGAVVDFRYLDVNPAFLSFTRMDPARVIGSTIREMIPTVEDHWIDAMAEVARSGKPLQFEDYSRQYNRWYELRAFQPEPGRVAILFNDITERRNIEIALRESERTLREMFENTQLATLLFDLDGRVTYCNEALRALVGLPDSGILGQPWFERFVPESEQIELFEHLEAAGGDWSAFPRHWRNHVLDQSGSRRLIEWDHSPVYDASGRLVAIAGLGRDLSAWEELEEQYRQSQKMEAIGRLAGGIAHDFNNLLTVINGYSSLALTRLDARHESRPAITEIQKAGDRAATLTRQLLAFSRKQLFRLRVLNLNGVVTDSLNMLSRLIGAHIRIDCELEPAPWMVRADSGQMLQVLLNLAVNSRDAITGSGRIVLQTANHNVPVEGDPHFPTLSPGRYVELRVTDDGSGMTEEAQRHLFEPFFTTKPPGEGTGLGLATVYGIVRQSGGAIHVRSRQGEGTVIRVLLPAVAAAVETIREAAPVPAGPGEALILLVEDQRAVRDFLSTVLEESGFRVVVAADGAAALELLRGGCRPDILLSDIVMPGVGGPALAAQARDLIPGLRVVFVSGYAPSQERAECDVYLQKPFNADTLLAALRPLLPKSAR